MDNITESLRVLGLQQGATFGDVRAAYRDLAKVWHPDRFPNDPRLQEKASEELKAINEAFHRIERLQETGGTLPSGPEAAFAGSASESAVKKRNPRRDTWTIRPPLRMEATPAPDRRRIRKVVSLIGGLLLIGGAIALLVWRWPL